MSFNLHLEAVTTAFCIYGRDIPQKIVLILILRDALHATEQIVGVENDKPSGAIGELIHNLLIVGGAGRKRWDDLTRLIVRIIETVVGSGITAARCCTTASAAPGAAPSGSTATMTSRAASSSTSDMATASDSATASSSSPAVASASAARPLRHVARDLPPAPQTPRA